jgi:hypothetical protein
MNTYLFVFGAIMISSVVIRFFYPTFGLSKELLSRLQARGTKRGFLISHNINGLLLGVTLIVSSFLPEHLKLYCLIPLLFIFLSVLICNKLFVGTFWAYTPKSRE